MRKILVISFLINSFISYAQNQEKQEIKWAKENFAKNYFYMNIESNKIKPIQIKKNFYKIGVDSLFIDSDNNLRLLVENKLLNNFLSNNKNSPRNYSIIGLKLIEKDENKKIRRFQVYHNSKCDLEKNEICLINPTILYFEISSNCKNNCNDEEFFKNGKLTYFKFGGIIL